MAETPTIQELYNAIDTLLFLMQIICVFGLFAVVLWFINTKTKKNI